VVVIRRWSLAQVWLYSNSQIKRPHITRSTCTLLTYCLVHHSLEFWFEAHKIVRFLAFSKYISCFNSTFNRSLAKRSLFQMNRWSETVDMIDTPMIYLRTKMPCLRKNKNCSEFLFSVFDLMKNWLLSEKKGRSDSYLIICVSCVSA
jgi:hypothetical protein